MRNGFGLFGLQFIGLMGGQAVAQTLSGSKFAPPCELQAKSLKGSAGQDGHYLTDALRLAAATAPSPQHPGHGRFPPTSNTNTKAEIRWLKCAITTTTAAAGWREQVLRGQTDKMCGGRLAVG